nr:9739_t:CDS:2 [Entrophospora candida]
MAAHNTPDGHSDIVFICIECKKDYDNNTLSCCEKRAFSSCLENKTRELEKELSTTKRGIKYGKRRSSQIPREIRRVK